MKNILVAMPFNDTHKAYIEKIGTDCEFHYTTIKTATAEEVKAADIIFGNISPELVKQNDHLEWMQLNSAGSDQYCKPGVIGPDTILTCATGAYGLSVSEHMVSMSMMLCRKMDLYMKNQVNHEWKEEGIYSDYSEDDGLYDSGDYSLDETGEEYLDTGDGNVDDLSGDEAYYDDGVYTDDGELLDDSADDGVTNLDGEEETAASGEE